MGKAQCHGALKSPSRFGHFIFRQLTVRPRRLIETARHPIDTAMIKSINGSGTS